jgi:alpha-beta hydrolase superfamily lysophospholipase
MDSIKVSTIDGLMLKTYVWRPSGDLKTKGCIQIVHGMGEHARRYHDVAEFFTRKGFVVIAHDQRGHGASVHEFTKLGFLGKNIGWQQIVEDIKSVNDFIKFSFPENRITILGHSWGSFLVRAYVSLYLETVDGIILSGTSWQTKANLISGMVVSKIQRLFSGFAHPSKLLDKLSFGKFNSYFKPNKTTFDWLSRDENVSLNYISDPYCNVICSNSFFTELFRLLSFIQKKELYKNLQKHKPFFVIAGTKDPVGNFTLGPKKFIRFLEKNGIENIQSKFYLDCRHEILNELNKEEVYSDIYQWICSNIFHEN